MVVNLMLQNQNFLDKSYSETKYSDSLYLIVWLNCAKSQRIFELK